jgi:hypothetical protein
MYIGDVGHHAREEVSFQSGSSTGGENFGWDAFEGFLTPPPTCGTGTGTILPGMVPPIYDYDRDQGQSVTGGYVYRGSQFPSMYGRYFFGDYEFQAVWSFVRDGDGIADFQDHTAVLQPGSQVLSFGEDARGRIYFTTIAGEVVRIIDPDAVPTDNDQDLLPDDVESDTGNFVDETDTGSDPFDMDTDNDRIIDGIEVELGTDPNDANSFPLVPVLRSWILMSLLALAMAASSYWIWRRRRA